jgi:hypothetical protein
MSGRDYVGEALALRDELEILELAGMLRTIDKLRARVAELEKVAEVANA